MDVIVNLIVEKTGMSEESAQGAAAVVINFLKDKLPDSVGGLLDNVVAGEEAPDSVGDLMGSALGGLFGGGDD